MKSAEFHLLRAGIHDCHCLAPLILAMLPYDRRLNRLEVEF